jgi:hypothetical protein
VTFNKKPQVGKLAILCRISPSHQYWGCEGWRVFDFGVLRLHTQPEHGEQYIQKHYHGFWFRLDFWLPFEVRQWK